MMFDLTWLVFLYFLLQICTAYNILVISPCPSVSHQLTFFGLSRALAEKGHNVTIFTSNPGLNEPLPNYHEINASYTYEAWEEFKRNFKFSQQTKLTAFDIFSITPDMTADSVKRILQSKDFQNILKSKSYKVDLILYEGLYPGILGMVPSLNYPVTAMLLTLPKHTAVHSSMGNTINPSYISSYVTGFSDRMTFLERIVNAFYVLYELYVHYKVYSKHDATVKKILGQSVPSVKDLERNVSLMLLSGDLSNSYPMPLQPNTIQFGAIHIKQQTTLPDDIKSWMDESDEGVIYFSLGSNMRGTSTPEDKRNSFIKTFNQFPRYRVIWKWESDVEFPGKPKNVLLKKWLPQQAVLAHPKIRLFITQGGHQSQQEAIHYGVPTLSIPLFFDQEWNARKMEVSGSGLTLNFHEITYETVYKKLKKLLNDKSFKINAEKISKISRDKPMSNVDAAVWWLEYVIRHKGAPQLRPAVQNLHWFQYTLLDIIAFFLVLFFLIIYFLCYFIKKLFMIKKNVNKLKNH